MHSQSLCPWILAATLPHSKDLALFCTQGNKTCSEFLREFLSHPKQERKRTASLEFAQRTQPRGRRNSAGGGLESGYQAVSLQPAHWRAFQAPGIKAQAGCPCTLVLNPAARPLNFPEAASPSGSVPQAERCETRRTLDLRYITWDPRPCLTPP